MVVVVPLAKASGTAVRGSPGSTAQKELVSILESEIKEEFTPPPPPPPASLSTPVLSRSPKLPPAGLSDEDDEEGRFPGICPMPVSHPGLRR